MADINVLSKIEKLDTNPMTFYQGEAIIGLSPFDEFIMFNIYKEDNGSDVPIDLNSYGSVYLNFYDSKNSISIKSYDRAADIEPEQGQVIFKITKEQSRKILGLSNNKFYITSKMVIDDHASDETVIYTGIFYEFSEYVKVLATVQKDNQIATYTDSINQLTTSNNLLINSLTGRTEELSKAVQALKLSEEINKNIIDYLNDMKAKNGNTTNSVYTEMLAIIKNIQSKYYDSIKSINSNSFSIVDESVLSDKAVANLVTLNKKQNVTDISINSLKTQ